MAAPFVLAGAHRQAPDGHWVVSDLKREVFPSWQENQGLERIVAATAEKNRFRAEPV
jgi:hypothetical protein